MRVTDVTEDGSISYEKVDEKPVAAGEYPLFYYAFAFSPPAALVGRHAKDDSYEDFALIDEDEARKHTGGDRHGFRMGPAHLHPFCAMLAKIAHSYAAAEIGLGAFQSCLSPFIHGNPPRPFEFIGGSLAIPEKTDALHEIALRTQTVSDRRYLVVKLRLFSFLGTPAYEIVAGELSPHFHWVEKVPAVIEIRPPLPSTNLVSIHVEGGGLSA